MAESRGGGNLPNVLAQTGFFGELAVTAVFFILAFIGITRRFGPGRPEQRSRVRANQMRPATAA